MEIRLIMCPPTSFSDHRISASRKICSVPQKDFFDSIGPKGHLVQCKDMSEVEVKANSKANAESMTARPEFLDTLPRPHDDGPATLNRGTLWFSFGAWASGSMRRHSARTSEFDPRDPEGTWRQGSWALTEWVLGIPKLPSQRPTAPSET